MCDEYEDEEEQLPREDVADALLLLADAINALRYDICKLVKALAEH